MFGSSAIRLFVLDHFKSLAVKLTDEPLVTHTLFEPSAKIDLA